MTYTTIASEYCHGKVIHSKHSNGYEVWYEYDGDIMIHSENSNGFERWFDSEGNAISEDDFNYNQCISLFESTCTSDTI